MSDNAAVEDSLAAAFNSSFSMPAVEPRAAPAEAAPVKEEAAAEGEAAEGEGEESSGPDWRPSYEANLSMWQDEAAVAREKAEATRAAFEADEAATLKAVEDAAKAKKDAEKESKASADRESRLAAALADESPRAGPIHKKINVEDRAQKVKEAWEMVKNKETAPPSTASVTASQWEEISAPHSSVEDISAQSTAGSPASTHSSKEKSGDSTTAPPPGAVPHNLPAPVEKAAATVAPVAASPGVPSLTLSLFTAPEQITVKRVLAAIGINLFLPFINGIMLGLGEITAREGVRITRLWWKGERALFGHWRRKEGAGAGSVGSVGLSGSAGF